jgi:hypothetical protein
LKQKKEEGRRKKEEGIHPKNKNRCDNLLLGSFFPFVLEI